MHHCHLRALVLSWSWLLGTNNGGDGASFHMGSQGCTAFLPGQESYKDSRPAGTSSCLPPEVKRSCSVPVPIWSSYPTGGRNIHEKEQSSACLCTTGTQGVQVPPSHGWRRMQREQAGEKGLLWKRSVIYGPSAGAQPHPLFSQRPKGAWREGNFFVVLARRQKFWWNLPLLWFDRGYGAWRNMER